MSFRLTASDGGARRGRLTTPHGEVETPTFMPVGTIGSVKAIDATDLADTGANIMLANTYHLFLRPGHELVERMGGLHRFTNNPLPMLTDSGGFQVMSLAATREIDDDGVVFASHIDGARVRLTPELAARIQNSLGVDIQMMLDVCPPAGADRSEVLRSLELSLGWARKFLDTPRREGALRFGIAQGGMDDELRIRSARETVELPFDGFAIGGLSVGEPEDVMFRMLDAALPYYPADRPRYLMGVGRPSQILRAVAMGVDMFDCVLPTRLGRHGTLWTREGVVRINRSEYLENARPLDESCRCLLCRRYSRAYLRHLYRTADPLYLRLASLHNLTYLQDLMAEIRAAVAERRLSVLLADARWATI